VISQTRFGWVKYFRIHAFLFDGFAFQGFRLWFGHRSVLTGVYYTGGSPSNRMLANAVFGGSRYRLVAWALTKLFRMTPHAHSRSVVDGVADAGQDLFSRTQNRGARTR
jgi:hypothetical protein